MTCLMVAGASIWLANQVFTLEWTHSVERTAWRETWMVEPAGLRLGEAAVKGSGAGMDPAPEARLIDGWYVWHPDTPPLAVLHLAASGATGGGWTLCADGTCRTLGAGAGAPVTLAPC
jgi:hypothetical protein